MRLSRCELVHTAVGNVFRNIAELTSRIPLIIIIVRSCCTCPARDVNVRTEVWSSRARPFNNRRLGTLTWHDSRSSPHPSVSKGCFLCLCT